MRKIRVGRLRKLIRFLNQLEPKSFDFDTVANECGTVCCAVGWTYKLFPNLVGLNNSENVTGSYALVDIKSGYNKCYFDIASTLFNISEYTAMCLFTPVNQTNMHKDLPSCFETATPKQVADMLKKFIQLVKENKIEGHCL